MNDEKYSYFEFLRLIAFRCLFDHNNTNAHACNGLLEKIIFVALRTICRLWLLILGSRKKEKIYICYANTLGTVPASLCMFTFVWSTQQI